MAVGPAGMGPAGGSECRVGALGNRTLRCLRRTAPRGGRRVSGTGHEISSEKGYCTLAIKMAASSGGEDLERTEAGESRAQVRSLEELKAEPCPRLLERMLGEFDASAFPGVSRPEAIHPDIPALKRGAGFVSAMEDKVLSGEQLTRYRLERRAAAAAAPSARGRQNPHAPQGSARPDGQISASKERPN